MHRQVLASGAPACRGGGAGAGAAAAARPPPPLRHAPRAAAPPPSPQPLQQQQQQQQRRPARRRRGVRASASAAAAGAPAPPGAAPPPLDDLPLAAVVTAQGFVQPEVPPGTAASVFAVYNEALGLEYVGFSKDLRSSLRTVLGRRPDRAHFFRAWHLAELDQAAMVAARGAWFDAAGGPPPGNAAAAERAAWQAPAEAMSMSDRGKAAAAEELARERLEALRLRGVKEEFEPDPELLAAGKVDFLATAELGEAERAARAAAAAAAAAATRTCGCVVDGAPATFALRFVRSYPTNGGAMFDVAVTFRERESRHRVIVGREFCPGGAPPEAVVERVFAFLLERGAPRQTEGLLLSSQFPVNYFSVSEVQQHFPDFADALAAGLGVEPRALPGEDGFWRFNRTQDYGHKGGNEDPAALAEQMRGR